MRLARPLRLPTHARCPKYMPTVNVQSPAQGLVRNVTPFQRARGPADHSRTTQSRTANRSKDKLARGLHEVDHVVAREFAVRDETAPLRDHELGVGPHQDLVLGADGGVLLDASSIGERDAEDDATGAALQRIAYVNV